MTNQVDWTCHSTLIVDDESAIRGLIARFLSAHGMTVLEAENGRVALERLDAAGTSITEISLVIADLMMPEMGGIQLMERLRQRNPNLPVLLISGFYEDQTTLTKALVGPTNLLAKPFSLQALTTAVNNLISEPLPTPV